MPAASFMRYVMEHRAQDSKYGDVARDIVADHRINTTWGYQRLRDHMIQVGAIPVVLDILDEMRSNYRRSRT